MSLTSQIIKFVLFSDISDIDDIGRDIYFAYKAKKETKMGRYKINDDILRDIESYAEEKYSLIEILYALNLSKRLKQDEQVLNAYERGLVKLFISMVSAGADSESIIESFEISIEQCTLWHEKYSAEIKDAKLKMEEAKKLATKQFSDPLYCGMVNILEQNGKNAIPVSQTVLGDDIEKIVKKVQGGDTSDLITILTTNTLQLQRFNTTITCNIMGEAGKQIANFGALSNMLIKVMQETRKNILAINEITNPKRTTFIKEANQHNHLHQNSEKKDENENELQKELDKPDAVTDIELLLPTKKVK